MRRIETILSREIGLCARSIGTYAVSAAASLRMQAQKVAKLDDYVRLLELNHHERRALVEEIVVSETWLFRDEEVFRGLSRYVRSWWTNHPIGVLRVLSIPCATGEEPYSIAVTLLEAGLTPNRMLIRAVDVSERALASAKLGVFTRQSLRGAMTPERLRYFEMGSDGLRANEQLRSVVQFGQGNVLDNRLASEASFDLIFCRNLLIYLDADARKRALTHLFSWLSPDGILVAGHAEAVDSMDSRFQYVDTLSHFSYRKRATSSAQPASSSMSPRLQVNGSKRPFTKLTSRPVTRQVVPQSSPKPTLAVTSPPTLCEVSSLERATELANRGDLVSATNMCEQLLAKNGPTAGIYSLLGVVQSALQNQQGAIDCFNKALYLDQGHYDALIHLALLHEQRGEQALAANFRRRAERLAKLRAAPLGKRGAP